MKDLVGKFTGTVRSGAGFREFDEADSLLDLLPELEKKGIDAEEAVRAE